MKRMATWKLIAACAIVAVFGCKPAEQTAGEGTGSGTAAAEGTGTGAAAAEGTGTGAAAGEGTGTGAAAAPAGAISAATLHDTWSADFQAMLASQQMAEEERALAMALMGSMQMTFTFSPTGTLTIATTAMGEAKEEQGTYSVTSVEGNVINATMTGPDGQTESMIITFADNDNFTLRPAQQEGSGAPEQIPFHRGAPTPPPAVPTAPAVPTDAAPAAPTAAPTAPPTGTP